MRRWSMGLLMLGAMGLGGQAMAAEGHAVFTVMISQFEGGHGFSPGRMSCFEAAKAMARTMGVQVLGPTRRIQVGRRENSTGQLTVRPQKALEARDYIDQQLAAHKPVVVGVSHEKGTINVDGLTDHFVLITGVGSDETGRRYYTFHDPGTTDLQKGLDRNVNNRFFLDDSTGLMYRPGKRAQGYVTERRYEVSMVRLNACTGLGQEKGAYPCPEAVAQKQ